MVGAAALALCAFAATPSMAGCVKAGGQGVGTPEDVAKFMATAALSNSIKAKGLRPAGKVSMSCKTDLVISTCTARQRACK